jgi:hypothetical protein
MSDERKAGTELDREVAERVFRRRHFVGAQMPEDALHNGEATEAQEVWMDAEGHRWCRFCGDMPQFSTDIAAAFLVVEKMRADGWRFSLDDSGSDGQTWEAWFCRDWSGESWAVAVYEERATREHAICLAALQAVAALPEGQNHG